MTDDNISNDSGFDRRKFLAGLGAGAAAGIAGCTGGDGGGDGTDTTTADMTDTTTMGDGTTTGGMTDTTTMGDGEIPTGGRPTIGMAVAPKTLNPLQAGTVYSFYIIDRVMLPGTTVHPETLEFKPWAFTDWDLNPDNAGTDEPTIANLKLREDLSFHDGEDLTMEDYAFSVQYYREQEPAGSLTAAAHKNLRGEPGDGVEVTGDYTANVYFAQKEQRWHTNILGFPILPQHIWSDVSDYTQYSPRNSDEGFVGAGPFELVDFNWQNWYELDARDDFNIPGADYVDWLDDGGPFVDGLRFEVFGSQNAMEQAILNGDIDAGFIAGGFSVNTAVQAEQRDNLTVRQSSESGYNHISFNLRRKPFDDPAFRQFLNKIFDKQWVVENPYSGIGAVQGDYVVIPALTSYRPPEPSELHGSDFKAEGIDQYFDGSVEAASVPDLSFPGGEASFNLTGNVSDGNLTGGSLKAARDFLVNNPEAQYDYSFGEAQTSITTAPDGKELYVDGEHINQAHTDNNGNPGQGPLVFSFQPPQEDLYQARYGQQYTGLLKKVGIPVEPLVKTINAQLPTIYAQEDFDMFAMGWGLGVNVTHLSALYSSEGADLEGNMETQVFNPMGYTNADELITRDRQFMDFGDRYPVVQQICAQIYRDAPTNITDVAQLLEPTSDEWAGWVGGLGTAINQDSFLNIRQSN